MENTLVSTLTRRIYPKVSESTRLQDSDKDSRRKGGGRQTKGSFRNDTLEQKETWKIERKGGNQWLKGKRLPVFAPGTRNMDLHEISADGSFTR